VSASPKGGGELWVRYRCATHGIAIPTVGFLAETGLVNNMAAESETRKDTMKVEKLSILVLTLCVVVLVYLVIFRPF
jgi:hypothetical protein